MSEVEKWNNSVFTLNTDLDKHVLCITTWSRFSDTGCFLLHVFLNTEPAISERQGLLCVPSPFSYNEKNQTPGIPQGGNMNVVTVSIDFR